MSDLTAKFTMPEDADEEVDVSEYFEEIRDGPEPSGRPEDYPGVETLTILHTGTRHHPAGKSFKPDPTGKRHAIPVNDYKIGSEFAVCSVIIDGHEPLFQLLRVLSTDHRAFVVRGIPDERAGRRIRLKDGKFVDVIKRRMQDRHDDGSLYDEPRQLHMLDLDGIPLAEGMSVTGDPEACVRWAIDNLLPREFGDVSFVYQLSSSAGLTKRDDQLSVHLWFFTDRPFSSDEMRLWARWWNAQRQNKIVDPAVFNAVQPHYTSNPELLDGLTDPLAGRRLGTVLGRRQTVPLYMPADEELTAQERAKRLRARESLARRSPLSSTDRPAILETASEAVEAEDKGLRPEIDGETSGAVRLSPGWRGYLEFIGFEGSIRGQIRAAIGSYFWEHSSRGDRDVLKAAIEKAIAESPHLCCDQPWSRPRSDAEDYQYAAPGGQSNIDEMIKDFAAYQADAERRAEETCEPTWSLPTLSLENASAVVDDAVSQAITDAAILYSDRLTLADPVARMFLDPSRTAVLCEPGVGKTEAVIQSICAFLVLMADARAALAVPTHHLGAGLAVPHQRGVWRVHRCGMVRVRSR
jgi:hypothetical protein